FIGKNSFKAPSFIVIVQHHDRNDAQILLASMALRDFALQVLQKAIREMIKRALAPGIFLVPRAAVRTDKFHHVLLRIAVQSSPAGAAHIFLWLRSAKPQDGPRSQKKMWRCVMVSEPEKISGKISEDSLGSLSSCLVDGDAEQRTRERRVRRRALTISIILQSAVLTTLILVPLFGKAERITFTIVTPIPPYSPYRGPARNPAQPPHRRTTQNQCHFCV